MIDCMLIRNLKKTYVIVSKKITCYIITIFLRRLIFFQRWASLRKKVTSLSVTSSLTQKSNFVIRFSVTTLQKVTEVTVTSLLRYFYRMKSQKRCTHVVAGHDKR